jgi:hypothetical protein
MSSSGAVRFVDDSPLEEAGFELLVPPVPRDRWHTGHRRCFQLFERVTDGVLAWHEQERLTADGARRQKNLNLNLNR